MTEHAKSKTGSAPSKPAEPDPERAKLLASLLPSQASSSERSKVDVWFAADIIRELDDERRRPYWCRLLLPQGPVPGVALERARRRQDNTGRLSTLLWALAVLSEHADTDARKQRVRTFEHWIRREYRLGDRELPAAEPALTKFAREVSDAD